MLSFASLRSLPLILLLGAGVASAQPAPEAAPAPAPAPVSRVTLSDGQSLKGRVLRQSDLELVLQLGDGTELVLARNAVKDINEDAAEVEAPPAASPSGWAADPNRTRYLYTPSAMMLRAGELSFSQKELLFSSFAAGITDWFSVQIGGVVPAWFFGGNGFNLVGALKVGAPVLSKLHLAAGVQAATVPFVSGGPIVGGFAFGTATYGTGDLHFSFSGGVPFLTAPNVSNGVGSALFTLSGNVRVARSFAVISENWFIPDFTRGTWILLPATAVRFIGDHLAADLGLIMPISERGLITEGIPIPWVDFTYNF